MPRTAAKNIGCGGWTEEAGRGVKEESGRVPQDVLERFVYILVTANY